MADNCNGIILVDKPAELSSAQLTGRIKKLFGAKKAGHTGTLDPFATGLMICCLNRATKLARFFLKGKKTYEAVLALGIETDTYDATGNISATYDKNISAFQAIVYCWNEKIFVELFENKSNRKTTVCLRQFDSINIGPYTLKIKRKIVSDQN